MDKSQIQDLEITLENIVRIGQAAFEKIACVKDKDLVIGIGNTGSGKSTVLSSLAFGPQNHEEKKIKIQADADQYHWSKVIDQKAELK